MDITLDRPLSRRDFLKLTGSLAAMGLYTSLTPDLLYAKPKTDLKGVTIYYWNMIGIQNPIVKKISVSIIKAFEQRTGAKVKTTWETYGSIIGPKYRTNFMAGKMPTVFDALGRWTGQIRGFLRAQNDFIEKEWDPKTREAIAWLFPRITEQNGGFPDSDQIKDLPFLYLAQAPVVTRTDHWKQAGLDFEKEWPIRDTEHFLEVLKAFKTSKVSKYPYEVYGKLWDAADTQLNGWVRSLDTEKSYFISPDWTRSNCDSEPWIKGVQFYVDLFRRYRYSSPGSPQSTDEGAVEQLIRGQKSIIHCDLVNRGTFLKRIPKEMQDGTIQWGSHFPMAEGTSGSVAFLTLLSFSITKQKGPDAAIKERAAWEFVKEWFRTENQIALAKSSGPCSRKDLWEELKGAPDHYVEATLQMMERNPGVWSNHPKSVDIQYNLLAPRIQRAMGGADVASELHAYAKEVNKILKG
jgi:ABC-type glycerol-3-phosphate transport system substrate-binding protein